MRLILLTKYDYKSLYEVDKINSIDLSLPINDSKQMLPSITALLLLSNKGLFSYKSNTDATSRFKSQEKSKINVTSSLIGPAVFGFLENLLNYYIPRIRYFKGFSSSSITKLGNFTFTVNDLMVFPELEEELETFYKLKDLKINFTVSNKSQIKSKLFFYSLLGFVFIN
jgi:large subunit ribosomal protein L5